MVLPLLEQRAIPTLRCRGLSSKSMLAVVVIGRAHFNLLGTTTLAVRLRQCWKRSRQPVGLIIGREGRRKILLQLRCKSAPITRFVRKATLGTSALWQDGATK